MLKHYVYRFPCDALNSLKISNIGIEPLLPISPSTVYDSEFLCPSIKGDVPQTFPSVKNDESEWANSGEIRRSPWKPVINGELVVNVVVVVMVFMSVSPVQGDKACPNGRAIGIPFGHKSRQSRQRQLGAKSFPSVSIFADYAHPSMIKSPQQEIW
jgi:hypothetical protein